jgi:hypothetical protein
MYIANNSNNAVNVFDKILNPGENSNFFFGETVVDTQIRVGDIIIFSNKLPSDINVAIDNKNILIDDHLKFEYFNQSTDWEKIVEISIIVLILCLFVFIMLKNFLMKK